MNYTIHLPFPHHISHHTSHKHPTTPHHHPLLPLHPHNITHTIPNHTLHHKPYTFNLPLLPHLPPRYADVSNMTAQINKMGVMKIEIPLLFFFPQDHPNLYTTPSQPSRHTSINNQSKYSNKSTSNVSRVGYDDVGGHGESRPGFDGGFNQYDQGFHYDRYSGYKNTSPKRNQSLSTTNNHLSTPLHTTTHPHQQHNLPKNNSSFHYNYKTPQDYDPKLVYGNSYVSEVTTDARGGQAMEIVVKAGVCFHGDDVIVEVVDEKLLVVGVEVKPENQKIMFRDNGRGSNNGGKLIDNDVIHIKTYSLPRSADPSAISCTMNREGLVLVRIPLSR